MKNLRHLLATAALLATAFACTPKPSPETPDKKEDTVPATRAFSITNYYTIFTKNQR
jgi:hypothetical protein